MHQSRSLSRMCRVLLAGAAAVAACAHAAVPASSPFGAGASGNFEPSKPLAGGGWQLLSDRKAPKVDPSTVAALAPTSAATAPAAVASPVAAVPAVPAPLVAPATTNGQRDWSVSPADGNYRLLIEKWARDAGWATAPWEPDQDVQIEGADAFTADFKTAVRRVLSATEMTDYSLKPCFYSNNLVRVVKLTTKCDPTK
ncbi:putative lipoprotein (plasmid) [Cupriavidus sp. U2]|uniref:toxin co-regulated pilus biosynthesis Q family protein n=1 Tax=Cupriavidus sp. U2 TaxID=2920269 RepID=UPI00129D4575|nr:toxin co-regulated pilus biosynthesis Q family protein [Cupriavidus sp. U2]KAI3593346.1 putative lipoprotein [Cupriavidus sp. U2]